ncbi:MAG: DNA alkylation repair protein [Propionibacteriaceae bacterium]|nr:DNA alkylation repair protein [Propionibacteriaceae bacterium]
MWYDELLTQLETHGDESRAEQMSAYMKNHFPFLGIQKPQLKDLEKPFWEELKKNPEIDWDFVEACWMKDYREAQYIALDYLKRKIKKLGPADLPRLRDLAERKSWWETVDSIDSLVGDIVLRNPYLETEMLAWSLDDNYWIRRIAIDFQLQYGEQTNPILLETIIINNLGSHEFFINKAIGWSLREYSKTNPEWVRDVLTRHQDQLAKLSIREASKYV